MGVIYKLKDEVVRFIISQRQSNPLFSCRQLAESASQQFGLHLSKSSVHDVLKESGIVTPRGRKPSPKFEIPQEKKKQIQTSLSQVKLLPSPDSTVILSETKDPKMSLDSSPTGRRMTIEKKEDTEISAEYEGAGRIFLKAVLWDLGIFSEENIKESDWEYYLTYSKGIKVFLENNKDFFIDLGLPIERCIKEIADGLVNSIRPLMVHKISDEILFKACMEAKLGFKIQKVSIVDENDHILLEFNNIMELNRDFIVNNIIFVENHEKDLVKRSKSIFFPQCIDNNIVIEEILNFKGFDVTNKDENAVNLLVDDNFSDKMMLQAAVEKLNGMYLRDEQNRLVRVKIC